MEEPHLYDWAAHYAAANTPWDLGGPHPELSQRLSDGDLAPPRDGARALVPGCGHGHDALALARRGWVVTAVDLVADLAETLGKELARLHLRDEVVLGCLVHRRADVEFDAGR